MTSLVLHRYPRLPESSIKWFQWSAEVDGNICALKDVSEHWDSNSRLTFHIDVSLEGRALETLGDVASAEMVVAARCKATARNESARAELRRNGDRFVGRGMVTLDGSSIATRLDLEASIVMPMQGHLWLTDRIIAQARPQKVGLGQDQGGFPTSVVSFRAEGWAPAPWRFEVVPIDLDDPFQTSVRLFVNEDYPQAVQLLDGTAPRSTVQLLQMDIARQLVAATSRLVARSAEGVSQSGLASTTASPLVDDLAAEHPESIVAAARKAAERYFHTSLRETCRLYREMPEQFEFKLMSGAGILKGEA